MLVAPYDDTGLECKNDDGYGYTLKIDNYNYDGLTLDDVQLPSGGSSAGLYGFGSNGGGPGGNGGFGGGGGRGGKFLCFVCCLYSGITIPLDSI